MAKRVNKQSFTKEVLEAEEPVLVEFYSDGCLGCKQFSPVLGEMEDAYESRIKIVKVNAAFSEELKDEYGVEVYPTVLFFRNGKEDERLKGIVPRDKLEKVIEKYAGRAE
ncbi:MAG: thioredoxin domain-containing protein [Eubacteriales bacterium]|nr:thioredoxin domain-containing protein [Eubacteriales bacterium]